MSSGINVGKIPRKGEHEIRCPVCNKLLFRVRDGVIEMPCTRPGHTMIAEDGMPVRRPCLGKILKIET